MECSQGNAMFQNCIDCFAMSPTCFFVCFFSFICTETFLNQGSFSLVLQLTSMFFFGVNYHSIQFLEKVIVLDLHLTLK